MPEELKYFSLVTNTGAEKLAQAAHDGTKINITQYALGDGNGDFVTPDVEMTSLIHECYRSDIQSYEISGEDPKQIIIQCIVPSEVGFFVMREWGLFDDGGNLIAVANVSDTQIVPNKTGEFSTLKINIYIQFENDISDIVNFTVDPLFEEKLKHDVDDLKGRVTILETSSGGDTDLEKRVTALETTLEGVAEYLESKI